MKKRHWLLFVVGLLACGDSIAPELAESRRELGGAGVQDATTSTAAELETPFGVAGAVAAVMIYEPGSEVVKECTGVLVSRYAVVTSLGCLTLQSPAYPPMMPFSVRFPQLGERRYAVTRTVALTQIGLAVLHVVDVPENVVEKIPPVFNGDVEFAIATGTLVEPVIAGFGESCSGCADEGVRRVGLLGTQLEVQTPGTVTASLDGNVGAELISLGDAGAPLFAFDKVSRRYALIGFPVDNLGSGSGEMTWKVFGRAKGDEIWEDHIADVWVPPVGPPEKLGEGETPGPGWLPLLGFDVDADEALDDSDNCPPSRCTERGLEMWECANRDQADAEGDGQGDRCDGLSAPVPEFCRNRPTIPDPPDGSYAEGWLDFTWRQAGYNSNVDAEEVVDVARKEDVCDPVPQLRFVESPVSAIPVEFRSDYARPDSDVVGFHAQPILGGGSWVPSLSEKVDFAFCWCPVGNSSFCVEQEGCDPIAVRQAGMKWKGNLSVGKPVLNFIEHQGQGNPWAAPHRFSWAWLSDAKGGRIRADVSKPPMAQYNRFWSRGLFASTVLGNNWTSRRDSEWDGGLRSVVALGEVAAFDAPGGHGGQFPGREFEPDDPWPEPHCDPTPPWVRDPGRYPERIAFPVMYPHGLATSEYSFSDFTRSGVLLVPEDGALWAVADSWLHADVTQAATPAFVEAIQSKLAYASPVEPQASVKALGRSLSAVGVAECAGSAVLRFTFEGSLDVSDLGIPLRVEPSQRLVFSALEDVLYLVGGSASAGTIRRVELTSGLVTDIQPANLSPTTEVLGASYDPGTATLFVLDVQGGLARLVGHKLSTGDSTLLMAVPFTGAYEFTSLDVAENGDLLLTVGTLDGYTSWRMDASTGAFLGRLEGEGRMLRLPTMGLHYLGFHYLDDEGLIRQQRLAPWNYEEGEPCTSL